MMTKFVAHSVWTKLLVTSLIILSDRFFKIVIGAEQLPSAILPRGQPVIIADVSRNATANDSGHCIYWDLTVPSVPYSTAWKRFTFDPRRDYSGNTDYPMISFTSNPEGILN